MAIVIAGGSGFVGCALARFLGQHGETLILLTRSTRESHPLYDQVVHWENLTKTACEPVSLAINLCGAGIAARRWTARRRQQLFDSRLQPAEQLINWLGEQHPRARLLNASAVGYYAFSDERQSETEILPASESFSHRLVSRWETLVAEQATQYGLTYSCLRFGVVLGTEGGMFRQLLLPARLGMGVVFGRGDNYLSWVHVDDLCRAVAFVAAQEAPETVYNITAPWPCTQQALMDGLCHALKRPRWLKMPAGVVRLLFGQMGQELLLGSQYIIPRRLEQAGFTFHYRDIYTALQDLTARTAASSD